jgi:thiamine kinase-like enzyme
MPTLSFITHVARTVYGLEPVSIESLEQYQYDWRGIYRLRDAQNRSWLMRMMYHPESVSELTNRAMLLQWLARKRYLAPVVLATSDQQYVGMIDGWATTLLTFIEGTVLGTEPADLALLARRVGRLHTLRHKAPHTVSKSRCHPDNISSTIQHLENNGTKVPHMFQALVADLHTSMVALQQFAQAHLCITHGDCWYMNAIKTSTGSVILIDWDNAGMGMALLELANLLLTAHFDLSRPLHLEPNESKISAIMQGYQQVCQLAAQDREGIAEAMRFLLAFQLGSYIADETLYLKPDFPFVLQKLQARYNATRSISDIAARYTEVIA